MRLRQIIIAIVLFAILFAFLAPVQLGGRVAYVIVNGNSMEPQFLLGDLILTQKKSAYNIADAVVYRHPDIGHVFHRIVDQEAERFILQGDNNDWLDSYQPTQEEILGKLWFHIPNIGSSIGKLQAPLYLSLFVLLVFITAVITLSKQEEIKKFRKRNQMNKSATTPVVSQDKTEILLVFGVIALAALILGIFAFFRPLQIEVPDNINYTHMGSLLYSAQDTKDVFDAENIQTGDPVFLQLTCR